MADLGNLGNPLSSLYPQPVQPAQNLFASNPTAALDVIGKLNANALFQQEFASRKGINAAFQGALNPDGSVDPARVAQGLQNPNITLGAGDAANTMLAQRQAQIQLAQQQFNLGSGQSQYLRGQMAALAAKPGATWNDAADTLTSAGQVDPSIPTEKINALLAGLPRNATPAQVKSYFAQQGLTAAGPGFALSPTGATTPSGARVSIPQGAVAFEGAVPAGLSPAASAAQGSAGASIGQQGVILGQTAESSPVRKAMLGNLEADLKNFTAGPGADWTQVSKAWANRNVLPTNLQFDPASIASQEAFTKQAQQLAQQQFQAIGGTGTDAKFGSAFAANPHDTLSQLGNQDIIRLLKGNEDALQAKNRAWQSWQAAGNGPETYQQFTAQFNQHFDPRVYQAQYMNQTDFVNMMKSMAPKERQQFISNMQNARQNEYAVSPGSYYNGQ